MGSAGTKPAEPSVLESPPRHHRGYRASWISCYDGDTCDFTLYLGLGIGIRQTVRFYGIDTPELRGSTREAGMAARDFVINILQSCGEIVLMVPQRKTCVFPDDCDERGRYGRLLANVMVDGQSLSTTLLQAGHAVLY